MKHLLAGTVAVLSFAAAAHANNIVQNPDFVSSNYYYPGYQGHQDPSTGYAADPTANAIPYWVSSGFGTGSNDLFHNHPFLDNAPPPAGHTSVGFLQGNNAFTQTLNGLTVGQTYSFSFYDDARNCCGTFPTLSASIGGNTLYTAYLTPGAFNYFSTTFTATGTSEDLVFSSTTPGDGTALITDVSVAPVPEPSSLALLGTGVLGVVGMARRKFMKA